MRQKTWIACLIIAAPSAVVAGSNIADLVSDQRATVSGVVDRVTDEDTFILKDHTGSIPVYLGPNRVPVTQGMNVTVHGIVDDDVPREIYANQINDDQGTTFGLDLRYE
ncbi:MAG: hypothetical protein ACFB11_08205 [Paracoccaceae bacterium]